MKYIQNGTVIGSEHKSQIAYGLDGTAWKFYSKTNITDVKGQDNIVKLIFSDGSSVAINLAEILNQSTWQGENGLGTALDDISTWLNEIFTSSSGGGGGSGDCCDETQTAIGNLQTALNSDLGTSGNIYIKLAAILTTLSSLLTTLSTAQTNLSDIDSELGSSGSINTSISSVQTAISNVLTAINSSNTTLGNIHSDLGSTGDIHSLLSSIQTVMNTISSAIGTSNTDLSTIHTDLGSSGDIHTSMLALHSDLTTLESDFNSMNTNMGNIHTDLGSGGAFNTSLGTLETTLNNVLTAIGNNSTTLSTLHTDNTSEASTLTAISSTLSDLKKYQNGSNGFNIITPGSGLVSGHWYLVQTLSTTTFSNLTDNATNIASDSTIMVPNIPAQTKLTTANLDGNGFTAIQLTSGSVIAYKR